MLVVLARRHDPSARAFVERFALLGTGTITCEDLSRPGWRFRPETPGDGCAVVGGRLVAFREIRGILTRLPTVSERELPHVVPGDRSYVAAEMSAFLKAWLAAIPCPVLNRPRGTNLCGPDWSAARWLRAAARAGFHCGAGNGRTCPSRITLVGRHCFNAPNPNSASATRALAAEAGVELLEICIEERSDGARFIAANLLPALDDPEIAGAVIDCLARSVNLGTPIS